MLSVINYNLKAHAASISNEDPKSGVQGTKSKIIINIIITKQ